MLVEARPAAEARKVNDAGRTPTRLRGDSALPRGPVGAIRIFVWRNGDWHPLPEDQQVQIKECLKAGQTVFKVRQGAGYWTLDTTARNGWMQIGRTRQRPLKFVEESTLGVSPSSGFSRGLNMRMPHGPLKKGRCLVDAVLTEWEAMAGSQEALGFEELVRAWRGSCTSCCSREVVVLEGADALGPQAPRANAGDEGLVRAAVLELWAAANLQPSVPLHRLDWLHLRLLEVQAPSQFALLGLSDAIREQACVKGDAQLHWRLLRLFLLGCQRSRGSEDGLLSVQRLKDALGSVGCTMESLRSSSSSRSSRLRRCVSQPATQRHDADARPRRPASFVREATLPCAGPASAAPSSAGSREEAQAQSWAHRVGQRIGIGRSASLVSERELHSRRAEEDAANVLRQLRIFLHSHGPSQLQTLLEGHREEEDSFTYYDFLNHMLERKHCPVRLHQYDLSAGKAWWLSPVLLCRQMDGVWHTGVVVFDREYWYGGRIFESKVGQTPYGKPTKVIDMGQATMRSRQELWHFVQRQLQYEFTVDNYDVLTNNCNHFSDAVCSFLINQHIPDEVLRQPQVVMRTPVVSLFRTVLNHQLGGFSNESSPPPAPPEGEGGLGDFTRSTCSLTAEEEWEQVQEGDLVLYEYEPGWTAVARVDAREIDTCDLHWLDLRLGEVHAEDEVPSGAVRLLPGSSVRRQSLARVRLAMRQRAACGFCS